LKRPFTLLFPAFGNLFVECWRLFVVNYLWLVLLVLVLSTVTYAGNMRAGFIVRRGNGVGKSRRNF